MNTAEFLERAKALINTPKKWTQKAYARNIDERECGEYDVSATCFCAMGATYRVVYNVMRDSNVDRLEVQGQQHQARNLLDQVAMDRASYGGTIAYNDSHTHTDVMSLFDEAIERAEAKG